MPFKLLQWAVDWCMPLPLPVLEYNNCDPNKPVNHSPLTRGITNDLEDNLARSHSKH